MEHPNKMTPGASQGSVHEENTPATTASVNSMNDNTHDPPSQGQSLPEAYVKRVLPGAARAPTAGDLYCWYHARRVWEVRWALGFDAVLIPVGRGTKYPLPGLTGF